MAATAAPDLEERWYGLCVTTPFYSARHRLEGLLARRASGDIRCITVDSLLWLADMSSSNRMDAAEVLRLLTSGPDGDFTIDLIRRIADRAAEAAPQKPAAPPAAAPASNGPAAEAGSHLSIVERSDRPAEPEVDYWLASLAGDETSTPEQMLDVVIRERHVLGLSDTRPCPMPVHAGDWVCFHIAGTGIVGHAQFDSPIAEPSAVIRGARRFTSVFQLRNVAIYETPNPVEVESTGLQMPGRMPYAQGAVLAAISRSDYESLTIGPGHSRGRMSFRE
jgi:hypothetical protein